MKFQRRDIILIAGLLLFMVGLIPFMAPFYAAIIVSLMYVGIKLYAGWQRQAAARYHQSQADDISKDEST